MSYQRFDYTHRLKRRPDTIPPALPTDKLSCSPADGSRVLPLVREFDPDVALLDIALPEKSGYELVKPFDSAALLALLARLSLPTRAAKQLAPL